MNYFFFRNINFTNKLMSLSYDQKLVNTESRRTCKRAHLNKKHIRYEFLVYISIGLQYFVLSYIATCQQNCLRDISFIDVHFMNLYYS